MEKYCIGLWVFNFTEVTVPTELSGMPQIGVLLMLILYLRLYPQFVFCTKRYVLLIGSSATILKVRLNRTVHSKDRFWRGREKFSEIWRMDDVELV